MIKECIILAGGLGTRLRTVVSDSPKVLAPVNGKPFLHYILEHVYQQHIGHIILSTGYMHEKVQAFVKSHHSKKNISFAIEEEPLGTGGGILNALKHCTTDEILILNGDTFFNIDYSFFFHHHNHHCSEFSVALKPMLHFDRYGAVVVDAHKKIIAFQEKRLMEKGTINAGVYILTRPLFQAMQWPVKFSMEKDYMEKYYNIQAMHGFAYDEYFIDIGIPSDFEKAQTDFKQMFS